MKQMLLVMLVIHVAITVAFPADVYVAFSPNGGCQDTLLNRFRQAKSKIDIAIYSFTSKPIAAVLDSAVNRGVKVRLVVDASQAAAPYSITSTLNRKIALRYGGGPGLMHNKFVIIDDSITITGSYNWSEAAEIMNDENLIVIISPEVASLFAARFDFLWTYGTPRLPIYTSPSPPAEPAKPKQSLQSRAESTSDSEENSEETVYITKSGSKYHRAGCSYLAKSSIPISKKEAIKRGYTPCSKCKP